MQHQQQPTALVYLSESSMLDDLRATRTNDAAKAHAAYLRTAHEIRQAFIDGITWRDIAKHIRKSQKSTRELVSWALTAKYETDESEFTFPSISRRSIDNTTTKEKV